MVDLSQYDTREAAESGSQMQMYLPDGSKAEGCYVVLMGLDSSVARRQERVRQQRMIERAAQPKRGGAAVMLSADEMAEQSLEELVELTVRFEGIEMDGEPVGDDKARIREAYERYRWLADDARAFIADRANFFPKSSGS